MNKYIITWIALSALILVIVIINIIQFKNNQNYHKKSDKEDYHNNIQNNNLMEKPYLWLYWESKNNIIPDYVQLCIESIKKHCNDSFKIVMLNDDLCEQYLGDFNNKIKKIGLAQRSDYLSYRILHKFGGFWIDTNSIVMKDLLPLYQSMGILDFIGFGCTGGVCRNGKPYPSVWALASKPNTKLMELCIEYSDEVIESNSKSNSELEYHDVGKYVLWRALDKLIKEEGYDYVHIDDKYVGHRDGKGEWTCPSFTTSNDIDIDSNDIYFSVLHGSHIKNWKTMNKYDVINHNSFAGSLLRKSLK